MHTHTCMHAHTHAHTHTHTYTHTCTHAQKAHQRFVTILLNLNLTHQLGEHLMITELRQQNHGSVDWFSNKSHVIFSHAHSPFSFTITFEFQSFYFLKFVGATEASVFNVSVSEVHLESSQEGALGELVWVEAEKPVVVAKEGVVDGSISRSQQYVLMLSYYLMWRLDKNCPITWGED